MGRKKSKVDNGEIEEVAAEKPSSQHEEDVMVCVLKNPLFKWEQRILCLLLKNPSSMFRQLETISPNDFHFVRHKILYKTMRDLYDAGESIDLVTLAERLRGDGNLERAGGAVYLGELVFCLEDKSRKRKKG